MKRFGIRRRIGLALVALGLILYAMNASWLAPVPVDARIRLIAHRGVHQTFGREGLTNETCIAERIHPPAHAYLENTIPSMRAAFAAGAEIVELDVHPTLDGGFAVFHDWTLDCAADGSGRTRDHTMSDLRALDVGYGYTADGGLTFPFRGEGVGMMPSLQDVLREVPHGRFLVNFKSNDAEEGDRLAEMLHEHPEWRGAVWGVYGGTAPTDRARDRVADLKGYTRESLGGCLIRYAAIGWSGYVPEACRRATVAIPADWAHLLWGWPHRFLARMRGVGTEVILLGPYAGGTTGIDDREQLKLVPEGFDGYVWTDRIEVIGPMIAGRQ